MEEINTFAYILGACGWSSQAEIEMSSCSYSDTIEYCISLEDQALDAAHLREILPFENLNIARLAPVQLVSNWDIRPYMTALFRAAGIQPTWFGQEKEGQEVQDSHIIYFKMLPAELSYSRTDEIGVLPADKERFKSLLQSVIKLAQSHSQGVIVFADWGWDYNIDEVDSETKKILKEAGMLFVTRHA